MLTPDYFYGKSDKLIEMYQELEDWIISDIAMRLIKSGEMSGTTDRELWKLQQMGLHHTEIVKRISKMTGKSRDEVRRLLRDSVMTSFSDDAEVLKRLGDVQTPLQNNAAIMAMNAEMMKTFGELNNLTRTTMLQTQRDLLNMLNEVDYRVASGMQSYNSAICEVLDRYAQSGVVIDYPTGARRSLEAAVRCCVVTSMNQTAAQVTNQYIVQKGIEYVLVSAHMGARHSKKFPDGIPSHDHWQGKVYKIVGRDKDTPNLLDATGYTVDPKTGQGRVVDPLGLHGYNCRHSHKPWDKSLRNPYVDADGNPKINVHESQELYEKQQQQRSMERAIRQTKRELLAKQAELSDIAETDVKDMLQPQYDKLAYKLRIQNQQYKQFCADNGLQTQADRIKVAGFKRAQSAKANGRATAYSNAEYSEYKNNLGKNMVSKEEFSRIMNDKSEKKLFKHYTDSVKNGDVSPLTDYDIYQKIATELREKCIGLKTSNGIELKEISLHSIDRVIGSVEKRRSGVTIDGIVEALTSPDAKIMDPIYNKTKTKVSQKFIYKTTEVSVNPIDHILIQANPHHRERE
ncbi:phage minor capsid protein [Roseburia sp. AM23-20]|uniref:phage minor capsid protein n=1 Tax=Roseburia sp. AM23-20 TaxID=2292066 RepID=UPI001FAAD321|nr:phage minor capsid protein [Roseburia sp. AM23-20]